ncbi:MAG: TetR/AcrR family transcriptional regulator [Actinomycetota bacterium]|nr:TetR/AcrR family transcriptional regulator [Actinomycetota bacterium]
MPDSTAIAAPQATPRIGRPRDESRRQALLDAAIELVAEVGYDRLSMDAVAARARASKATIYRRWPGKAAMVAEAVRRCLARDPAPVVSDQGSLRGDLLALVELIRTHMAGSDGDVMFGLALAARSDPELGGVLYDQLFDAQHRVAAAIVERAQARGEEPAEVDPAVLDEVGPGVMALRQMLGQPLDDAFVAHVVDDILLPLFAPLRARHPSAPTGPERVAVA